MQIEEIRELVTQAERSAHDVQEHLGIDSENWPVDVEGFVGFIAKYYIE